MTSPLNQWKSHENLHFHMKKRSAWTHAFVAVRMRPLLEGLLPKQHRRPWVPGFGKVLERCQNMAMFLVMQTSKMMGIQTFLNVILICHKMAILWQWISNSIYFFESETFWRWNPRCSHCSLENWSGHQFIRSPNHDQSELTKDMRLSIVMGVLQNGWFIFGKIPLKWMITGGTPIYPYFRKHPNKSK